MKNCSQGYACFPLSQRQLELELGASTAAAAAAANVGVCAFTPEPLLLPDFAQVPAPM